MKGRIPNQQASKGLKKGKEKATLAEKTLLVSIKEEESWPGPCGLAQPSRCTHRVSPKAKKEKERKEKSTQATGRVH
eukprot:815647-Pelagomonas_calceolata.AAC.1